MRTFHALGGQGGDAALVRLVCDGDFLHAVRICRLASALGHALGVRGAALFDLETAALLHDVGKLLVSKEVLYKPGRLTAAEFDLVKRHPTLGVQVLLAGVPERLRVELSLDDVHVFRLTASTRRLAIAVAASHHERLDGSGYPLGLSGDEIPLAARIVAVADVYDALRSDRCYRPALPVQEALGIVRKDAKEGKLDWRVVRALEARVQQIEEDLACGLPDEEAIRFRLESAA